MRRPPALPLLLAAALLLAPAAAGAAYSVGPYAGLLQPGETATHRYDNRVPGVCPDDAPAAYTVTATVTNGVSVTLSAGGRSDWSTSGFLQVAFEDATCTHFDVTLQSHSPWPTEYAITVTRA